MVGAAAQGGHHLAVDNVIAVGSPGMLVEDAGDLNLDPNAHGYASRHAMAMPPGATVASMSPTTKPSPTSSPNT
jgi:hypothetical protein